MTARIKVNVSVFETTRPALLALPCRSDAVHLPVVTGGSTKTGRESRNEALLASCYDDVRRISRAILARDQMNRAYQATELANEAAIRLMGVDRMEIKDKAHMLAMAARTMRRILIDEARKGAAAKRQTPAFVTQWPDDPAAALIDIGDLDRALEALASHSPEHAEIVELRFMLGLTVEEASLASGIPERTIKRRWQAARAWLLDYLNGEGALGLV